MVGGGVGIMVGGEGVGIMVGGDGEGGTGKLESIHPTRFKYLKLQVESLISQPDVDDFGPRITWSSSGRRGVDGGKEREREREQR